jgi:hypothetical protein
MKADIFTGLRENALRTEAHDIGVSLSNEKQVYAGIVDIYANYAIATLVCMFDGTVSMYYSNGRVDIGLGERPKIKKAAMNFLFNAGQCLPHLKTTENTDVTVDEGMRVYLKVLRNIYAVDLRPDTGMDKVGSFLFFLIQNILSEIRFSSSQSI